MFRIALRALAVIGLAFTCDAAQAGLVVFDSTTGLNAGTITNASNAFNSSHGIRFEVANGSSFSLNSAYFAVRSSAGTARPLDFAVELYEVGNATPLATVSNTFSVAPKDLTVIEFNNLNSLSWSLSGGKKYIVQVSGATGGGSLFKGETSETSFTQNFVTFETFLSDGNAVADNYWIQLNADPAVVPEPATIGLLAGGLGIGLGQRIRRRRRKASTDGGAAKSATAFGKPLHRLKAVFSR